MGVRVQEIFVVIGCSRNISENFNHKKCLNFQFKNVKILFHDLQSKLCLNFWIGSLDVLGPVGGDRGWPGRHCSFNPYKSIYSWQQVDHRPRVIFPLFFQKRKN